MSSLSFLNRSIRSLDKKQILSKLTKSESKKYKELKGKREELRRQSSYSLKKTEKFVKLTNEQRGVSLKINNLKKKLEKSEKVKDRDFISREIKKLEKDKIKIQEKKFKNSKKFIKISYARRDLVQKTKLIYKIMSSEKDMKNISKSKQKEIFADVIELQEEIQALNVFFDLPVVKINSDGIITADDLKSDLDKKEKDTEYDEPGIWELKETIDKKIEDNPNSFETIEVYFPNGRFYEVDLTEDSYKIEWESVSTEFYTEMDNIRLTKGSKTYIASVIYNFSDKKISISSNYTLIK